MTPIWNLCLVLGFAVTNTPITDVKYSEQQARPVLTVLVLDRVGTDPTIRDIARAQAIRILDNAGVELRWIDANGVDAPHLPSTTTRYATVVIAKEVPGAWDTGHALGFAPVRTWPYPRAYVFTSLIKAYVQDFIQGDPGFPIILGHAIVHELGHLAIPGDAHGIDIMRHDWGFREWQEALGGTLLFDPGQARVLRQALQSN